MATGSDDDGCAIREGGGAHFSDDLWTCETCGHQKYPEAFACPRGRAVPFLGLSVPRGEVWRSSRSSRSLLGGVIARVRAALGLS